MKKLILVILMVMLVNSQACAWGGSGGYRYYGGHYSRGSSWLGIGIAALAVGTIVHELNRQPDVVVVQPQPYYVADNVYYNRVPQGYMVVEKPRYSATVNVPNIYGSYTIVTLTPSNGGWIGPQGELYTEFPSVHQLQIVYGK